MQLAELEESVKKQVGMTHRFGQIFGTASTFLY
jgi:hypothetical protein